MHSPSTTTIERGLGKPQISGRFSWRRYSRELEGDSEFVMELGLTLKNDEMTPLLLPPRQAEKLGFSQETEPWSPSLKKWLRS
jgi:hypothetical protein